jgi:hypothetical protein
MAARPTSFQAPSTAAPDLPDSSHREGPRVLVYGPPTLRALLPRVDGASSICWPRTELRSIDQPIRAGLVQNQKANFAPRVGFAYQATPKLVVRGGFGIFYNSFENQGYSPNIGENYPFAYKFQYSQSSLPRHQGCFALELRGYAVWASCATAGPGGTVTMGAGLSCMSFSPLLVDARGLGLGGCAVQLGNPPHAER